MNTLYRVTSINQITGYDMTRYIVAPDLKVVEDEITDITNIEVLGEVEILTREEADHE